MASSSGSGSSIVQEESGNSSVLSEEALAGQLIRFKLQCLFYIGIVAVAGGLLPLKLRVKDRLLSLGNVLSGGIFLAAGFTHMLSEAVEGFTDLELMNSSIPIPYALCTLGILATFFIEKVAFNHNHHNPFHDKHAHSTERTEDLPTHSLNNSGSRSPQQQQEPEVSRGIVKQDSSATFNVNMYMLTILLSFHSIIEGMALGIEDSVEDATTLLIAIVGHKFFSAFAFGVSLAKNNIPTDKLIKGVLLFAFMTPFGILLGLTVLQNAHGALSQIMNAITAGTFIYIALVEIILEEFENPRDKYWKFLLLVTGALLMTGLSAHGDHSHVHDHTVAAH